MASSGLTITALSLFLLPLIIPAVLADEYAPPKYPVKKMVEAVVEGTVYCQKCDNYGSWSLADAEPIPSAKISVICKNYKEQVSFYKVFQTDSDGYFYAQLTGFKMGHSLLDHPLHACHVKLVSSPREDCSLFSNINNALNGAPLRYENKRVKGTRYEAVIYAAGPLAFRPNHCPAATSPATTTYP